MKKLTDEDPRILAFYVTLARSKRESRESFTTREPILKLLQQNKDSNSK